ncbi:Golgin Subfamily A Member 3 [Manis pentadactyla]|nr:Golgin Subfamily A Member 3 [Manis pentadactyla]
MRDVTSWPSVSGSPLAPGSWSRFPAAGRGGESPAGPGSGGGLGSSLPLAGATPAAVPGAPGTQLVFRISTRPEGCLADSGLAMDGLGQLRRNTPLRRLIKQEDTPIPPTLHWSGRVTGRCFLRCPCL